MTEPVVLYEDNHLLALDKPAGWVTQGAAPGDPSAVEWAKDYFRERYRKPGNVYVGVVSRLDASATGVLLLARTSKAAARLSAEFRERRAEKLYWALVEGRIEPAEAVLRDRLWKDESAQRMRVVEPPADRSDAQAAELSYVRRAELRDASWVEVRLITGRKHQIRVQFAHRGYPILGDRKYGGRRAFPQGIALHARELTVRHPVRDEVVRLVAPVPASWRAWGFQNS